MGEVEYERALYQDKDAEGHTGHIYLLEQELGFETAGFVSDMLAKKMVIAYIGAEKTGKNRYNLIGKVACGNFEGIDKYFTRKEGVIAETYNVDEIEMRILNGGGANWVKRSLTDDTVHYQLDTFHRNKAVLQYVPDPDARKAVFRLLFSKQIDLFLDVIEAYSSSTDDKKERENYLQLLKYFQNDKDGL